MPLPYVKSPAAARELHITYSTLCNLIRHGHLSPPEKDGSGDFVWCPQDLQRARQVLAERGSRRREEPAHAG